MHVYHTLFFIFYYTMAFQLMNSKIGCSYGTRTIQYLIIYFCIDSIFWTIGGDN